MLLNDVEVVEEPFAGRADVAPRGGAEPGVDLVENPAGPIQPIEERRPSPSAPRGGESLGCRDGPGSLAEVLGPKELAADRTDEDFFPGTVGPAKPTKRHLAAAAPAGRA